MRSNPNVRPRVPAALRAMPGLERVLQTVHAVAAPLPVAVQCRLYVAASSVVVAPVSRMRASTPDWERQRAPYARLMGVFGARLAAVAYAVFFRGAPGGRRKPPCATSSVRCSNPALSPPLPPPWASSRWAGVRCPKSANSASSAAWE